MHKLLAVIILSAMSLSGCGGYRIQDLAKSDIAYVADVHLQVMREYLQTLARKLYARNPAELAKVPGMTVEARLQFLDSPIEPMLNKELYNRTGIQAMELAFSNDFSGDRVFALMVGLTDMMNSSYNNQEEFFMFNNLDQQKLYDSARNIEILVWRLSHRFDEHGRPFLVTHGLGEGEPNLSFERLFGKMIATQDTMANIVADRTNRTITRTVHNVASFVFIPI